MRHLTVRQPLLHLNFVSRILVAARCDEGASRRARTGNTRFVLTAARATGLEQGISIVALIFAAGMVLFCITIALGWRRARGADDRAEAIRLTLGPLGAALFYLFLGLGVVVMMTLGIVLAGQQSK